MRMIHRFAETSRIRLMVSGGVLWVIACLAFAGAVALEAGDAALIAWLLFAITLFSIAQMLYIPTARSLAATVAPAGMQGRYVAAFELSWVLAGALGPALYGVMFDIDPAAPWLAMAGIVAAGIVVLDARMRTGPGIHPVT